jgi:hypothetical protein
MENLSKTVNPHIHIQTQRKRNEQIQAAKQMQDNKKTATIF